MNIISFKKSYDINIHSNSSKKEIKPKCIPAYVVTGALHSGKTTFINSMLQINQSKRILYIQFEKGNTSIETSTNEYIKAVIYQYEDISTSKNIEVISSKLASYISMNDYDEVWIEWTSNFSLSKLYEVFNGNSKQKYLMLSSVCKIKTVICIYGINSDGIDKCEPDSQKKLLTECDIVALHGKNNENYHKTEKAIKSIDSNIKVIPFKNINKLQNEIEKKHLNYYSKTLLGILAIIITYLTFRYFAGVSNTDLIINIFIGIVLQAFPFLLIGILLSSAIHVFVPKSFIQNHFPVNPITGGIFAALSGFFLPVCDCASVPIFKSIVKKGVPLSSAITFMMATPVINPVVIISTWYAFGYNIKVVLCRVLFGIICAMIIGLTFTRYNKKSIDKDNLSSDICCKCCCDEENKNLSNFQKLTKFFLHAETEFFEVGKYLIIGALISAVFQTLTKSFNWTSENSNLFISLIVMMTMAFSFSLCSSSDAIVGRSFLNQFPIGAIMGFLVFGPMVDIKNIIMLSGSFSKSFVIRLCVTTIIVCFVAVYVCFKLGLGSIII